jgi:cytochrome oxidase Cu insertion factor (SCO1/SenC/PrrC family)
MKNRMKRASVVLTLLSLMLCLQGCRRSSQSPGNQSNASSANQNSASQTATAPQTHLKVGDRAPDFTLNDTNGKPVRLSDFRGKKNVVLAFYVLAFTGG